MTNEEFEKELKRIEQVVTELRNKLLESKADKKPYEVEVPGDIGDYYNPDEFGITGHLEDFSTDYRENCYKRGLAFKTEKEVEQFDKERMLLFKEHKWAEEHNGGWTPNWNDNDAKYYVEYEYGRFLIKYNSNNRTFTKLPYFKSEELAREFIDEFRYEIIEVLC